VLQGGGQVTGDVLQAGEVRPQGMLTVSGSLTQTADALTHIELRQRECDLLQVGGEAHFGGTLEVTLPAGVHPRLAQQWTIAHVGALRGRFDRVILPQRPGLTLRVQYVGDSVVIVCEPATGALHP